MRYALLLSTYALVLVGCANTAQTQWQTNVLAAQAAVPAVEAVISASPIGQQPAVIKAELNLTSAVSALTNTPVPADAQTVLTDMQTLLATIPPNVLSPAHQAEISAGLAAVKFLVASGG